MPMTTELRWFHCGSVPDSVVDWFQRQVCQVGLDGADVHPEVREDRYLWLPGCEFLNLKVRQGRLEAKLRQATLGVAQFGDRWSGQVERWVKWGCKPPSAISLGAFATVDGVWIGVKKARSQRHYPISSTQMLQPELAKAAGQQESASCSVELTRLEVHQQDWWSLALEATGSTLAEQWHGLQHLATELSQSPGAPLLKVEHSYAYPKWLWEQRRHL